MEKPPQRLGFFRHASIGLMLALIAGVTFSPVQAKVYTLRQGAASLEDPQTFDARQIYGGKFRINGHEANMRVCAGNKTVSQTAALLRQGNDKMIKIQEGGGLAVGTWGSGNNMKRFVIYPIGQGKNCLTFILEGNSDLFKSRKEAPMAWPESIPQMDPSQKPLMVVEHLDTGFVFACAQISTPSPERVLEFARNRMQDAGWEVKFMDDKATSSLGEFGVELMGKGEKTCWLGVTQGSHPGQTIISVMCRSEK